MSPELAGVRALLCDADGTLFPSEEPAHEASAAVVNRFLAGLGEDRERTPAELQSLTNGKNFRAASQQLAASYDRPLDRAALDRWVHEEKDVVTAHLREVLRPDPAVREVLEELAVRYPLSAVTSSARSRLDACLEVTDLASLFAPDRRFSAEDSLPEPTSKPDPAIYTFAGRQMAVSTDDGLAVEDSLNGVLSAVAAGYRSVGMLAFVPLEQQEDRRAALREAGAVTVVSSWAELAGLLR